MLPSCVDFCVAHLQLTDPTYTDESYIGTSVPPQWNEPNPNQVWLIPRMQQLIQEHYPGTKLSISEWSSTADTDITGGLVAVDQLGIYGRYGVDSATYWEDPDEKGPVGLAFWLYRGYVVVLVRALMLAYMLLPVMELCSVIRASRSTWRIMTRTCSAFTLVPRTARRSRSLS